MHCELKHVLHTFSISGAIMSGEEVWQYICNEEVEEIRNAQEGAGEMRHFIR